MYDIETTPNTEFEWVKEYVPFFGDDYFIMVPIQRKKPATTRPIQIFPLATLCRNYEFGNKLLCNDSGNPNHKFYELTLTQPPSEDQSPHDILAAFDKIVTSTMWKIEQYIRCVELQKNGEPHIHALLVTTKYINKSKINYKHRFTLSRVKDLKSWLYYIFKEKNCKKLNAYCMKHNISSIACRD